MKRALVARKVIQATWAEEPSPGGWVAACVPTKLLNWRRRVSSSSILADAIAQVSSTDNTLSLWVCDGTDPSVDEVALAFAAGMNTVSKLDLALVPVGDLISGGLELDVTDGSTPVAALQDRHRDLVGLTLGTLSSFARILAWHIRNGRCVKYTRAQVRGLLLAALDSGTLTLADLRKGMRKEMEDAQLEEMVLPVVTAAASAEGLTAADTITKSRKGDHRVDLHDSTGKTVGAVVLYRTKRQCTIQPTADLKQAAAKKLETKINGDWPQTTW